VDETVLRARTPTELVDTAVQLLRRHYSSLVIVSGIGMAPLLVVQPMIRVMIGPTGDTLDLSRVWVGLALTVVTAVWYSVAAAAIVVAAAQGYLDGRIDIADALKQAVRRIGPVLYASLIRTMLMGIGALAFFIGFFYYYATYFGVPSTVMLEKLSGSSGLKRSRQLANGHRWHVLKTMGLVFGIYFIIIIAAATIAGIAFGSGYRTLAEIFQTVVRILVYPLVAVTEVLVYFDLRIRVDGYDVEVMASRLDSAVAPAAP
jgi:hypothetical protein